jgi:Protein of unknown function (DUF3160)
MNGKQTCCALLLIAILAGCSSPAAPPPPPNTPSPSSTAPSPPETALPAPVQAPIPITKPLPLFSIDWTQPFASTLIDGSNITLTTWTAQPYAGEDIAVPLNMNQVVNPEVLEGLTAAQKDFLARNGFVVIHSQEEQFGDIRKVTARETGQPYYLSTDAAYHALHLLFDDMLKAIEREHFGPQMIAITQATLEEVSTYAIAARGTALEADTKQALAYLYVALRLFDPETQVDSSVADIVYQQVEQILAANGRDFSVIFPDFEDDYGAYKPVGHYAGDPELEAYFRGMTWYGHMHFLLEHPDDPTFVPSRLPLIITLALRNAQVEDQSASDLWAEFHRTLTFVVGPSDDAGPLEYADLMDQVYDLGPQIEDLADDALWQKFLASSDQLPAPEINSLFIVSTKDLTPTKGWRFMGQRFTLDGMIFQHVIFDKVDPKEDGTRRELPSGLDVMAAFGSQTAYNELDAMGITTFPNYPDQLGMMQQAVQEQPKEQWLGRFYDSWLYSFLPIVKTKETAFPAFMQTTAWGYKDMNTALGSWAELKHDTTLYTKMPEMAGGGGPPTSGPALSYVEPNPDAFYRMAYMTRTLSCGLTELVLHEPCGLGGYSMEADMAGFIYGMDKLGNKFETLGNIAARELAGEPITDEENNLITECLGMIECLNKDTPYSMANSEMPKVPVIAAVSGADDSVLEVAVGEVDRIYTVVPLEGQWEIAQGGVFSYYEFEQPRANRLTDDEWRDKLAAGDVELPTWASNFVLPGGSPTQALFFRIGDIYVVTEDGNNVNFREEPSYNGTVLRQLRPDNYLTIIGGPVKANDETWWNYEILISQSGDEPTIGWVVENRDWFERSYH